MLHTLKCTSFAKELFKRFSKPLFITRGSRGSLIIDEQGISEIPGIDDIWQKQIPLERGTAYLAGAASTLAAGFSMAEAAHDW